MPVPSILLILFPTRVLHLFTLSLFAAASALAAEESPCPPRYSYCGYSGPEQWKNLPIPDNDCGRMRQSPINLGTPTPTPGPAISIDYKAGPATIRNTGHDIEVTPTGNDNKITIGGNDYKLLQFHFHVPNEHRVPKIPAAVAEIHILHEFVQGDKTYNAVIGVMLISGTPTDSALAPVFKNLPTQVCAKVENVQIAFNLLLPKPLTSYYTYVGSLTTPPCTETVKTVTWYVLDAPRTILSQDLAKLCDLGVNARPIQPNQLPVTYVRPTATPQ